MGLVYISICILSPLVLVSLRKRPRSIAILVLCKVLCIVYGYYATVKEKYWAVVPEVHLGSTDFYASVYGRLPLWNAEFVFSYFILKHRNQKLEVSKEVYLLLLLLLLLSIVSLVSITWCGYFFNVYGYNHHRSTAFSSARLVWPFAVCWIILPCSTGNTGLLNGFSSHWFFCLLEKFNNSVFLMYCVVSYTGQDASWRTN